MSDVYGASGGDIFVDPVGKLWRVIYTIEEPSICMEEIEPSTSTGHSETPPLGIKVKATKSGGKSGLMWEGFRRIYSPNAKAKESS